MCENPLVRIFALLDRRLGKRRLPALKESMERDLDWVRTFYLIRMRAEGCKNVSNLREQAKGAIRRIFCTLTPIYA